jgi:RNA polymerase sigma factor (sigma-70 family)
MKEVKLEEPLSAPLPYAPGGTTLWNNSWRQIYDHFGQAVLAYARRCGLDDHSSEDVLQEVMTTLIRCQYGQEPGHEANQGSFQAWLWGVIKNRVRSVRRKGEKVKILPSSTELDDTEGTRGQRLPEVIEPPPDFAQNEEEEWQRALLAAALKKVRERISPKNFSIYTALLSEQASAAELAERHGMKANAVHQVKARCEQMILCEARAIQQAWQQLGAPPKP